MVLVYRVKQTGIDEDTVILQPVPEKNSLYTIAGGENGNSRLTDIFLEYAGKVGDLAMFSNTNQEFEITIRRV